MSVVVRIMALAIVLFAGCATNVVTTTTRHANGTVTTTETRTVYVAPATSYVPIHGVPGGHRYVGSSGGGDPGYTGNFRFVRSPRHDGTCPGLNGQLINGYCYSR